MKVGLCGLGDRLSYVAKVMSELIPNFQLVAYADPTPAKLDYMISHGFNLKGYAELSEMLDDTELDLLMVGSPNHLHLEHIRLGLERKLKIFTEKPIVVSEEQTFAMLDLLKEYDAVDNVIVGMVLRYSLLYKDLKASVDSGRLGKLVSIEAAEHIAPEHGAFFQRDWRRNINLSGGFMLEKCCHDLDLYQGVVGCRAAKVSSFGSRRTFTAEHAQLQDLAIYHERKSRWGGIEQVFGDESQLIDNQVALIQYEDGTNFCFHTNLNVPDEYRHFTVVGTHGMAEGDFVRNYYKVHDAQTSQTVEDKTYQHDDSISKHYGAEEQMAADWIKYFNGEAQLPVSILDALEAGLTAIKIDEAMAKNEVIDLSEAWARFDSYGLKS